MKKLAILTSVLALTACGGGSGGGNSGLAPAPTNISSINLSELESVDFSCGDNTYNFIVENGVVAGLKSDGQRYDIVDGNEYTKTNEYDGVKETEHGIIDMLGVSSNLKYSDFGYIQRLGYETNDEFTADGDAKIIAGGMQKYEVTQPVSEMTFVGTAVAALTASGEAGNAPSAMISKTNDAVLTFDGTSEHLIMNFSKADNPWYDVVINGTVATISTDDGAKIDSNFHMSQTEFDLTDTGNYHSSKTTYYGADNNPTEVISTATFNEGAVWVETAFGGTSNK